MISYKRFKQELGNEMAKINEHVYMPSENMIIALYAVYSMLWKFSGCSCGPKE